MILICQVEKQELSLIFRLKLTSLLKTNNFVLPINRSCVDCVPMKVKKKHTVNMNGYHEHSCLKRLLVYHVE
jgi:hypothetical protein